LSLLSPLPLFLSLPLSMPLPLPLALSCHPERSEGSAFASAVAVVA
jgi:hypothetical protein